LRLLWYPAYSVARSVPWPRYCVDFSIMSGSRWSRWWHTLPISWRTRAATK
jgi:hypothetical protein